MPSSVTTIFVLLNCCGIGFQPVVNFGLTSGSPGGTRELSPETRDRCQKILEQAIDANSFWPAMHAAEGLTAAGHHETARQGLVRRLSATTDNQQRCGVYRELVRAGDCGYVSQLVGILQGPDRSAHIHAAESLYKIGEIGDGQALRRAAEQREDSVLRLMANGALARAGSLAALHSLREDLEHGSQQVQSLAAWILGRVGAATDIPRLRVQLQHAKGPADRFHFVNGLIALGDDIHSDELREQLRHDNAEIRAHSAEIVGVARRTDLADRLQTCLDDVDLDVRIRAAHSLLSMSRPQGPQLPNDINTIVFEASEQYPRYTEGAIIRLRNNDLLFGITEFQNSSDDFAQARIVAKTSRDGGQTWGTTRVLQENTGQLNVMSVSLTRIGSPVSLENPIGLFFLRKNAHDDLDGYVRVSNDEAKSFGEPRLITSAAGYHVINNDRVTRLTSGRLLVPVAHTADVTKENHFKSFCYLSDDGGESWRSGKGTVDQPQRGAMEPEVLELADGRVLMIVRTQLGYIGTAYSADGGDTWSAPARLSVPAPEAPATLRRIPATGHLLLIWNNTYQPDAGHGGPRTPLTAAISTDEGISWQQTRNLEARPDRTYSYTSVHYYKNRVVMSYWEGDPATERYSARFRSLPVGWFYGEE